MRSMTSLLKETTGIACPTAFLLRVHHRACALLEMISDPLGTIVRLFPAAPGQR